MCYKTAWNSLVNLPHKTWRLILQQTAQKPPKMYCRKSILMRMKECGGKSGNIGSKGHNIISIAFHRPLYKLNDDDDDDDDDDDSHNDEYSSSPICISIITGQLAVSQLYSPHNSSLIFMICC